MAYRDMPEDWRVRVIDCGASEKEADSLTLFPDLPTRSILGRTPVVPPDPYRPSRFAKGALLKGAMESARSPEERLR